MPELAVAHEAQREAEALPGAQQRGDGGHQRRVVRGGASEGPGRQGEMARPMGAVGRGPTRGGGEAARKRGRERCRFMAAMPRRRRLSPRPSGAAGAGAHPPCKGPRCCVSPGSRLQRGGPGASDKGPGGGVAAQHGGHIRAGVVCCGRPGRPGWRCRRAGCRVQGRAAPPRRGHATTTAATAAHGAHGARRRLHHPTPTATRDTAPHILLGLVQAGQCSAVCMRGAVQHHPVGPGAGGVHGGQALLRGLAQQAQRSWSPLLDTSSGQAQGRRRWGRGPTLSRGGGSGCGLMGHHARHRQGLTRLGQVQRVLRARLAARHHHALPVPLTRRQLGACTGSGPPPWPATVAPGVAGRDAAAPARKLPVRASPERQAFRFIERLQRHHPHSPPRPRPIASAGPRSCWPRPAGRPPPAAPRHPAAAAALGRPSASSSRLTRTLRVQRWQRRQGCRRKPCRPP